MALGTQMVDFIGLKAVKQPHQTRRVGEIGKVQKQPRLALVPIWKDAIDAGSIETAGPALNAMNHIAFIQQKFSQVGSILTGDSCD
jgi:hypothetical protein